MRATMAYFAGVGTVVVAVAAGLGGGLLISNIVSPHEPKTETSKLEQRMSSKPIPVSNAPSEPVSYLAATTPVAPGSSAAATAAPQTGPAAAASTPAPPAEAQGSASAPVAASVPQTVPPVAQAANSEQVKAPENAVARASDADVRREARREARRLEQKRRAERRQQWADRRRPRPDQELLDVEAKVREETEPRQAFRAEPASLGMPRIRLFEDE